LKLFSGFDLDVSIVSYGMSKPHVQDLVRVFSESEQRSRK
jgi:hypothetical protein